MNITIVFFLSLFIAIIGVIPPGLLNMTAVKISVKEGHTRGLVFSMGVCVTVLFQTFIAVIFARYLSNHPDIIKLLQRFAFVFFVIVSIYFFVSAKKEEKQEVEPDVKSKKSHFFQGLLLASLNVLPIPYHAYMSITLASFGWLVFDKISISAYVAGAATGTMVILYVYIFFFDRLKSKRIKSQKNMNYLIGTITSIISIITLVNIIKAL